MKSWAAWVLAFSAGVWTSVTSVVPPVNRKFQPTPSRIAATWKLTSAMPSRFATAQSAIKSAPAAMTVIVPKRLIRWPVTNEGANMPSTCHWIVCADCEKPKPQKCMASGIAVISSDIIANPTKEPSTAMMKVGCRMICSRGRPVLLRSSWSGGGMVMKRSTTSVIT